MWKITLFDARRKRARTVRTNVKLKEDVISLARMLEVIVCNKYVIEGKENMTTVDVVDERADSSKSEECSFEEALLWLLQGD